MLSAATGDFGLPGEDFGDDDLDEVAGDTPGAMLEIMLALGGEDRFLDMARQQLGKDVFDELRRELGGNNKQFARTLVDLLARGALPPDPGANADAPPDPAARPRRKPRPRLAGQKDLFDD